MKRKKQPKIQKILWFLFQPSTLGEVRETFQQIILLSYERALYLKCLNSELTIPPSLIVTFKNKGLLSEGNKKENFIQKKTFFKFFRRIS